ncbi:transketolase family protein, partial [Candidatus Peregrinibacteria bacterium]|nr:transketolase family protein [Candidatus Peregrinibacteria bacterium]
LYTTMFASAFPERHFNMGIAEQNMIGCAAGFAIRGKIPFACTFAVFAIGRAWEQVRTSLGYGNLNVKVIGSHAGISVGEDGASHQALEDIAIARAIPNFKVFCPVDAVETKQLIKEIVDNKGPAYVRLSRPNVPIIYDKSYRFKIGFASVLKDGTDVCIFATGMLVHSALEAAKKLEMQGISTAIINVCSIKPIDEDLIAEYATKCKMLVSAEDHNIIGGLGGAIAEVLTKKCPKYLYRIGVEDVFGESGKYEELYKRYGLDEAGVYQKVFEKWRSKAWRAGAGGS